MNARAHITTTLSMDDLRDEAAPAAIKAPMSFERIEQARAAEKLSQLEVTEITGMVKAFEMLQKFTTVGSLKLLAQLKETKKYKGMELKDMNGKLRRVGTWDEFCKSIGLSANKIDEDLQNLASFGEGFLETSRRLELGYRDLRKLRKLPEDEQQAVIQEVEISLGDKDAIVSLIDDLASRHAREKQDWAKERADLEKRADRSEARVNAAIEVETKALMKERDQLIKERDALAAQVEEPDWQRTKEFADRMADLANQFLAATTTLVRTLPADMEIPTDLRLRIEAQLYTVQTAGQAAMDRWIGFDAEA